MIYCIQNQNEEARTAYENFIKSRMSPIRSLKDIMPYFPFTDPKTSGRIAEALLKAGVPGTISDNYIISRENLLNGQEIRHLLFGRRITGTSMVTGKQVSWEWAKSGEFKFIMGAYQATGNSWVEGDIFFVQFEKRFGGIPYGNTIFRNPVGSRESSNEYYLVSDLKSITPFTPAD
jgi:hypothetical protein